RWILRRSCRGRRSRRGKTWRAAAGGRSPCRVLEERMTRVASLVLVVRDLERALAVYEQCLGFSRLPPARDRPSMGARQSGLGAQNCTIELLEPHDDQKPPGLFLRERGEGVFAVAVGVDDVPRTRERLGRVGVEAVEAGGAVTFLRPRDAHGVL